MSSTLLRYEVFPRKGKLCRHKLEPQAPDTHVAIVSPPHAVSVPSCPSDTFTAIIPLKLGRRRGSERSDCAEEETEVRKGNTACELPPVAHTYGNVAPGPAVFFFTTLPAVVMASWLSNPDYKTLGCSF